MPRQKVNESGEKTVMTGIILYKRKGGIRPYKAVACLFLVGFVLGIIRWLCINIQGMKQDRGGQQNLGILKGDSGGTNKPKLGAKPPIFPYISCRIPPQDSQVSLSTHGLFHTLDIYTEPFIHCQMILREVPFSKASGPI